MSRELKFRAWDKENEEYRNGYDVLLRYDGSAISRYALGALDTDMPVNAIIEQYTGLKDKNGKEIYEGDIVKIEAYSRFYQVVYRKWDCSFVFENDEYEDIVHIFKDFPDKYEVIGNIHENPELLGGKK